MEKALVCATGFWGFFLLPPLYWSKAQKGNGEVAYAADFGMLFLGSGSRGGLLVHLASGLAGAAGRGGALHRHGHLPRRAIAGGIFL